MKRRDKKKGDIFEMVVPLVVVDYVHLNHDTLQSFVVAIYISNQPIKYHLPPPPLPLPQRTKQVAEDYIWVEG